MDNNLRREIILNNYENPFHYGEKEDKDYIKVRANNESCIDDLTFTGKIEDNVLKDIWFTGEACAISTSAASIMNKLVINKSIPEIKNIINNYEQMINEGPYDEALLDEAVAYNEIYKQANRKKCALLPYEALKKMIKTKEDE